MEDSSFATFPMMDTNDLDLTPFETTTPFTAPGSNTASPNFSSFFTAYQQVRNIGLSTATAALRVAETSPTREDPSLPITT
jgi:hypothetical protein